MFPNFAIYISIIGSSKTTNWPYSYIFNDSSSWFANWINFNIVYSTIGLLPRSFIRLSKKFQRTKSNSLQFGLPSKHVKLKDDTKSGEFHEECFYS